MLRERDAYHGRVTQAWETAALATRAFVGKLPKLERLLSEIRPVNAKTMAITQIEMLSDHLGIPIRPMSPEAKAALQRLRES